MKPQRMKNLGKTAVKLAKEFLEAEEGLEFLRLHDFPDDESAHDDELTKRLYGEFSIDLEEAQTELTKEFGKPTRTGKKDDKLVPLNGVFRFAVWKVGKQHLFVAAHHEDRGIPIILAVGITPK